MRFEGMPGEFSQHDFGQVEVRYADGTRERVKCFASCLEFSPHVFAHRADLGARLAEWHQRANDERASRATGEVPRAPYHLE